MKVVRVFEIDHKYLNAKKEEKNKAHGRHYGQAEILNEILKKLPDYVEWVKKNA